MFLFQNAMEMKIKANSYFHSTEFQFMIFGFWKIHFFQFKRFTFLFRWNVKYKKLKITKDWKSAQKHGHTSSRHYQSSYIDSIYRKFDIVEQFPRKHFLKDWILKYKSLHWKTWLVSARANKEWLIRDSGSDCWLTTEERERRRWCWMRGKRVRQIKDQRASITNEFPMSSNSTSNCASSRN